MSDAIEIRAYVVGFGDCILLRLPDGDGRRHVLVDFGRAPNDRGSLERFPAIAADIAKRCGGTLDLLVATHEHLDHNEGFYRERAIFDAMQVDQVWMGLPSHPDYYTDHPKAKLQKRLQQGVADFCRDAARRGLALHPAFQSLLLNNLANKDRLDYLRTLGVKPVAYLARGKRGARAARWTPNIKVRVLAPEEDTSVYYGRTPRSRATVSALARTLGKAGAAELATQGTRWDFPQAARAQADDLPGLSTSDLNRLREAIREDGVAAARFIDRAQNNTSLALLFEVAGKRLLLPGDAELESWAHIEKHCRAHLHPVDFLKVSHHGSHNGTPSELLDTLLPVSRKAKAKVLVSTKRNVYGTKNPVPDKALLADLRRRCSELVTTDGAPGTHVDLRL
jgi:hypothetical protein